MAALYNDKFKKVGFSTATSLGAPGHLIGGTSITVGSTTNWPTDTGVTFAIDRVELVGGEEVQVAGSYTLWQGTVTGATTIANMVIHANSPNSDQNYSAGSLTRVYIPISAGLHNDVISGILTHANQNGTLITQAVRDALSLGTGTITGWEVGALPDVSTVTHNGNRSYDVAFASSIAATLSEGMRLQFTKTVAGNGYMGGAFNGSSHYFTKTSPTGTLGTVTNNFTIEAEVQPTSYVYGGICGNIDSGPANGWFMDMLATGQVRIGVYNAGAANYSIRTSYQSLPLNKKTHVSASWTSGTVVMYFDGVAVSTSLVNSGTLPVTAAVGGTFSIGRVGAVVASLFNGYISNVAVFDAVLSAATIKQHATYKLTGSETNCIGAWSLDNTANDQSSAGNNLTATGGVGFTAQTPHGQLGNGVETTKSVGLVMNVSGSTATVQVPEGCTIPTTGGITSVAYSTQANPYGWVSDKGRWEISTIVKTQLQQSSPVQNTWYNPGSTSLAVPTGKWLIGYKAITYTHRASGVNSISITLSTANNSESNSEFSYVSESNPATDSNNAVSCFPRGISTTSSTNHYLNIRTLQTSIAAIYTRGDLGATIVASTPSGL